MTAGAPAVDRVFADPLFVPLSLARGPVLANRLVLAPLTNCQSHDDGTLSADEFRWLTMRAQGGFAMTMTCAAHVQAGGRGFPGQLGNFSDRHLDGLGRLAAAVREAGSVAVMQLHHAGMRSPPALIGGQPVCPSDDEKTGARALTAGEVERLRDDFIGAARRAERAGFHGVEIHGAHGYLICQFLSAEVNRRTDRYGGSSEGRARLLFEIVAGIRAACRDDFVVGVRLSPERFGLKLVEMRGLARRLMDDAAVDYLDLSLWDVRKEPEEEEFRGRPLHSYFTGSGPGRSTVRLGAAGKIMSGAEARDCLAAGFDFAIIGRAAVLHHDFPAKLRADPQFRAVATPVTADYLRDEGLGPAMVDYMRNWKGFVAG